MADCSSPEYFPTLGSLPLSPDSTLQNAGARLSLTSQNAKTGTLTFPATVSGRPSSCSQNPFNFCLLALGASILAK
jgi:hypothetical protein